MNFCTSSMWTIVWDNPLSYQLSLLAWLFSCCIRHSVSMIFRALGLIHKAIREKSQLRVVYQSLNNGARNLTLETHRLVYSGFHWHIRAYSHGT
jgi:hypothetical protein